MTFKNITMNFPLFYVIGFMKNYAGGFSAEESIYQRISFTGDDFKISAQKKKSFEKLISICQKALNEAKLDNDITIEYWENKKGAIIYSKNIVTIICDFFHSKNKISNEGDFILETSLFDEFDWRNRGSSSHQQRLSFLCGTSDSNEINNKLYFHNDYQKCILVHSLLKCFADEDDTIVMESYFRTPYSDSISINKDGDIWHAIKNHGN